MEMNSSPSVLVMAPGCPAELIEELFQARILPSPDEVVVLLPPGNPRQYDQMAGEFSFSNKPQFIPSPAQKFFSLGHLKWLKTHLKASRNTHVLITELPSQDPTTAMVCLTVLMLAGKTITLLFATPEAVIDLHGQGFSERWLTRPLNLKTLAGEVSRILWFLNPWNMLYFLMFFGLILRQRLKGHPLIREMTPSENSTLGND